MLEEQKGVVVAMPFADDGRVEVWATKSGALTEKAATKIIETEEDFEVLGFDKKPAKPRAKQVGSKGGRTGTGGKKKAGR